MRICILTFRLWGLHEGNRIKTCVASQFAFNTTYGRNAVTKLWQSVPYWPQFTRKSMCTLCVSMTWPNNTSQFACAVGCPETIGTNVLCNTLLLFQKQCSFQATNMHYLCICSAQVETALHFSTSDSTCVPILYQIKLNEKQLWTK